MGSSYFGMPNNMGNDNRRSSSSSSSRKSKKSSSSDKPKQPQRGLGVAQLEQIRMRSQMGCGFPPSLVQEDMRVQGIPYATPQSSTSYPYSQSSPSTSSPYVQHPNFMMVFGDHERPHLRYQDSQPSNAARWNPNGSGLDSSPYAQADISSRHLFSHSGQDSRQGIDLLRSMGSSNQNSDSSEHEEVDLELRLSI